MFAYTKSIFAPVKKIENMTHVVTEGDFVSWIGAQPAQKTEVTERPPNISAQDQPSIHNSFYTTVKEKISNW